MSYEQRLGATRRRASGRCADSRGVQGGQSHWRGTNKAERQPSPPQTSPHRTERARRPRREEERAVGHAGLKLGRATRTGEPQLLVRSGLREADDSSGTRPEAAKEGTEEDHAEDQGVIKRKQNRKIPQSQSRFSGRNSSPVPQSNSIGKN